MIEIQSRPMPRPGSNSNFQEPFAVPAKSADEKLSVKELADQ
jgi:hypothetical protein